MYLNFKLLLFICQIVMCALLILLVTNLLCQRVGKLIIKNETKAKLITKVDDYYYCSIA